MLATDDGVFVRTNPTFPAGPESNRLIRLDAGTGERQWSVEYHTRYDASQLVGATPDVVVLATDDHVAVFDARTGDERWWEYTLGPAMVAVGSAHVVIADGTTNRVIAYDALRHRQVRLLGGTCGYNTAVAGTTAVQVSCTDADLDAAVYDLRPPD